MSKAPEPSPWGLVIFLVVFVLLIWSQSGADSVEISTDNVDHVAGTCSIYYSDWPCLEEKGC
jgi:hypothetical protein